MKKLLPIFILFTIVVACHNSKDGKHNLPIVMGDSSSIITDKDSSHLKNYVKDITPNANASATQKVKTVMHELDSAKKVESLNNETPIANTNLGQIDFTNFSIAFSTPIATNTKEKYSFDAGGYANNMQLKINTLSDAKVEQRLYTQLHISLNDKDYTLEDLGTFICPWNSLPNKDNLFICNGNTEKKFFEINNNKIKLAVKRELKKDKVPSKEIKDFIASLNNTNDYTDAPCSVKVISSQFKVTGKAGKTKITKIFKIDVK